MEHLLLPKALFSFLFYYFLLVLSYVTSGAVQATLFSYNNKRWVKKTYRWEGREPTVFLTLTVG